MKKKLKWIFIPVAIVLFVVVVLIVGLRQKRNGLEYVLNDDGESYSVAGLLFTPSSGDDLDIKIAAEYNGLPVTAIQKHAFSGYGWSIKSITIPSSVTFIGDDAFSSTYLSEVHITDIASWCNIQFEPGTHHFSRETNLYLNNELVTELIIPDGVTSISSRAFNSCTSLEQLSIPDSVTSIGANAFVGCSNLESIIISSGNSVYHSNGNCIIETESKTLITGCKNTIIPSDGSVKSIGEYAFYGCSNLGSITIPFNITSIANYAFSECSSLASIYYEGTKEQWENIASRSWNSTLVNFTVYCTDGVINHVVLS